MFSTFSLDSLVIPVILQPQEERSTTWKFYRLGLAPRFYLLAGRLPTSPNLNFLFLYIEMIRHGDEWTII